MGKVDSVDQKSRYNAPSNMSMLIECVDTIMTNPAVDDALCLMKQRHGETSLSDSLFRLQTLALVPDINYIPRVLLCLSTMIKRGLVTTPKALSENILKGPDGSVGLNVHTYAKIKTWQVLREKWEPFFPERLMLKVATCQAYDAPNPSEREIAHLKSLGREVPDIAWIRNRDAAFKAVCSFCVGF